jgi:ribosomal protein L40E
MAIALIGLLIGLVAAGLGIYVALYAAGFFNYLGGKKGSPNAVKKETLATRLLALNDASKPYHIQKGEDTDLIAEWKIVDASWYGIFNKNGLSEAYRARLFLDETRHSVRCFEELGSVSWSAGTQGITPAIHYERSQFGGRILFKKQYAVGYGIKDPATLEAGKVYDYKFDVDEIRKPIIAAVRESGWEWVPVTAKKYTVYQGKPPVLSATAQDTAKTAFCRHCGIDLSANARFCRKCGKPQD